MLLTEDRLLGETMIRMVPTPKLPSSNFEANDDTSATPDHTLDDCSSLVDFNLDLLPSENLLEDSRNLELPPLSPDSACLTDFSSLSPPSPNDQALLSPLTGSCTSDFDLDLSATMFSPSADVKVNSSTKMGCLGSPGSTQSSYGVPSPSSPFSRAHRFSSTDSTSDSAKLSPAASNYSLPPSSPYSRPAQSAQQPSLTGISGLQAELAGLKQEYGQTPTFDQGSKVAQFGPAAGQMALKPECPVSGTGQNQDNMITGDLDLDTLDFFLDSLKKDIKTQSEILNIPSNPSTWSKGDVQTWLQSKMQELKIPAASLSFKEIIEWAANFDGPRFAQLSENDFKARLPQGGEHIYTSLDMWRNASSYDQQPQQQQQQPQQQQQQQQQEEYDLEDVLSMLEQTQAQSAQSAQSAQIPVKTESGPASYQPPPPAYAEAVSQASQVGPFCPPTTGQPGQIQPPSYLASVSSLNKPMPPIENLLQQGGQISGQPAAQFPVQPPPYPILTSLQPPESAGPGSIGSIGSQGPASIGQTEDDTEDETESVMSPGNTGNSGGSASGSGSGILVRANGRSSSSTIHLWQFIKDLLKHPEEYSGCIHWNDKDAGIFKIVDSVRVAELWGKRKNRPAMNFDKLSRSLRQYYKKGIMKKTARPQRLVYQFCSPYHL